MIHKYFLFLILIHVFWNKVQKKKQEEEAKARAEAEAAKAKKRGRKPGGPGRRGVSAQVNSLSQGFKLQTYIFRVLKEAAPEYGISKKAINMLNEVLVDSYDLILQEARGLMIFSKK